MPLGRTHSRTTIASTIVTVPLWLYVGIDIRSVLLWALGCLTGLIVSPDLDVDDGFIGFHFIRSIFGRFPAWLYQMFWKPYALLVPHRSFFSHSIFGTFFRLMYIMAIPLAVCLWLGIPMPYLSIDALWFVGGLFLSDLLHVAMDYVSKEMQ